MGPGLDQSMQYNELYVPSNPSQSKTAYFYYIGVAIYMYSKFKLVMQKKSHHLGDRMCRGELHKNPAYTRGDSQANGKLTG